MNLSVAELFGPTIQGEGPSTGRRAVFVRLSGCNLDCGAGEGATWACDTPYTWDWTGKLGTKYRRGEQAHTNTVESIAKVVNERVGDNSIVVVTGGEPLIQQRSLLELVEALHAPVEIETNGTIVPRFELVGRVAFNVSPKLPNSGVTRDKAIVPDALAALNEAGGRFKFVAASVDDLDHVQEVVDTVGIPTSRVWVMPAGTDAVVLANRASDLVQSVIDRGWNLTPRLHVQLWGNRRGV